jgi:hypothetical protein
VYRVMQSKINRKFHVGTETGSTFFDCRQNDLTDVSKKYYFFKI